MRSRGARWAMIAAILLAVVLVPFALFEEPVTRWAERLMAARDWWAGPAVVTLLALDVFLPVPSSMVSTASGALLGFWGGTVASTLGLTFGSAAGYAVGRGFGPAAIRRTAGEEDEAQVRKLWERHGVWTLVLIRGVPVVAEASTLFAGLSAMPLRRFLLVSAASNLCLSAAYSATGAFALGPRAFAVAFAVAVLIPLAAILLARRA